MTRTFSKETWNAAQQAWSEGGYGREWRDVRHAAAMKGMAHPPEGSAEDPWEATKPSQRAIVYRALDETPVLLMSCIRRSSTWSEVIAKLIQRRDQWREELRERDIRQPADDAPTHGEAAMTIKQILNRIGES